MVPELQIVSKSVMRVFCPLSTVLFREFPLYQGGVLPYIGYFHYVMNTYINH